MRERSIVYLNNTDPFDSDAGGGELRMWKEAESLSSRGNNVTIISSKTKPDIPGSRMENGVEIISVKCLPDFLSTFNRFYFYSTRGLFAIFSVVAFLSHLRQNEIDLVVDNQTPHPSLAPIFSSLLNINTFAIVYEYHDITALQKFPKPIGAIQILVQNLLKFDIYDGIIVMNRNVKQELEEYGVNKEIEVIPCGIDTTTFSEDPREEGYDVVVVSRLVHRKGIDRLIRAMRKVVTEREGTELGIVGTGPKEDELKSQARKMSLCENIDFLGFVEEEKKNEILVSSSLFVLPSKQEGFGIAVLEAMAAGLPVVVNDLHVLRDLVPEEGGAFVDAGDPTELANAILELLNDENKRKECGDVNKSESQKYEWKSVVERAANYYESKY